MDSMGTQKNKGQLPEKLKHSESSTTHCVELNREAGLLHTAEQRGGLFHADKQEARFMMCS